VLVTEGEQITLYPGKDKSEGEMVINISPGMALPVPAGFHIVKNTGSQDAKVIGPKICIFTVADPNNPVSLFISVHFLNCILI
jgi:hypothetical protein